MDCLNTKKLVKKKNAREKRLFLYHKKNHELNLLRGFGLFYVILCTVLLLDNSDNTSYTMYPHHSLYLGLLLSSLLADR